MSKRNKPGGDDQSHIKNFQFDRWNRSQLKEIAKQLLPQLDRRVPAKPVRADYEGASYVSYNPYKTAVELAKAFANLNSDGAPSGRRGRPAAQSPEMIAVAIEFLIRHRGMKPVPAMELVAKATEQDLENLEKCRQRHRESARRACDIGNISAALPVEPAAAVEEILSGHLEHEYSSFKIHLPG